MIEPRLLRSFNESFARRINRAPSPVLAIALPWVSIMLASIAPAWPLIASAPLLPPLGFMMLLAWRQLRPGLLPIWAGLPLGMWDDIFSGQPFGSGILLWSLAMIALDLIEGRFPWRNVLQDWGDAAMLLASYLIFSAIFANPAGAYLVLPVILPQLALAALLHPMSARLVALIDRMRLARFMAID
jgi:rod shape-determining protein MreD